MSRPQLVVDTFASGPDNLIAPTPVGFPPVPVTHRHESVFRTVQLELRLYSPEVKLYKLQGHKMVASVPVFRDHDQIIGSISLNPRSCSIPGRITLSFEGTFLFSQPNSDNRLGNSNQKRVFFTSTHILHTSESPGPSGPKSVPFIRDALANSVRRGERKQCPQAYRRTPRSFPFKFEIPCLTTHGQELPPSFNLSSTLQNADHGKTNSEQAEVSYTISALWEAHDHSDSALLEAPMVFHHDEDFHSLDGVSLDSRSWLELPLRTDRTCMPFQCAITLPTPTSCPRSSSIPYFVVFTTQPRCRALSREIAADASITVSLLRVVTINICRPYSITSGSESAATNTGSTCQWFSLSDDEESPVSPTSRLMKRVVNSAPPALARSASGIRLKKPLHRNGAAVRRPATSETRTLQTDMSIGFPKRPRCRGSDHQSSSVSRDSLPDGLYKGKVQLDTNMLPSIDWAGLNIRYYLDVSVLFGQDELRARVPVRIF